MSVAAVLICVAIGPALGSDSSHTYETITDLKVTSQEISLQSLSRTGVVRKASYKTTEWGVRYCPGTIMAENKQGDVAFLKNMATMIDGEWQGHLIYETPEGVRMHAPVACQTSPNPACKNQKEEIPGWN